MSQYKILNYDTYLNKSCCSDEDSVMVWVVQVHILMGTQLLKLKSILEEHRCGKAAHKLGFQPARAC